MSQEFKPSPEDDVQMPLGVGGGTDEAAPTEEYTEPPKLRINTSTMALVASFGAALAVLYFLGLQNKPRSATADDLTRIQATNAKFDEIINSSRGRLQLNGAVSESDRLSAILEAYFGRKPTIEDLADDPFRQPAAAAAAPVIGPGPVIATDPVDPHLVEAAKVFSGLKLQMVVLGQSPSALINNQIVNVGAHFDPLVVTDIKADRVILSYKDRSFELKSGGQLNH